MFDHIAGKVYVADAHRAVATMTAQTPELDPVAIRKSLYLSRAAGRQFDDAWIIAVGNRTSTPDERAVFRFMKANFRAAYYDDTSTKGRCLVPERDVSNALLFAAPHVAPTDYAFCRSGDGCDRPATCGRYGRTFCEHHHAELERIAALFWKARHDADPRAGGNSTVFGTKGKRKAKAA